MKEPNYKIGQKFYFVDMTAYHIMEVSIVSVDYSNECEEYCYGISLPNGEIEIFNEEYLDEGHFSATPIDAGTFAMNEINEEIKDYEEAISELKQEISECKEEQKAIIASLAELVKSDNA